MATIGTFKRDQAGYTGAITTLAINAKVRFVPTESESDKGVTFRIFTGKIEVGAPWSNVSKDGRPYLSAKLDWPSLPAPVYATLVEDGETAGQHTLIWSRRTAE